MAEALTEYSQTAALFFAPERASRDQRLVAGMQTLLDVIARCGQRFLDLPQPSADLMIAGGQLRAAGKALIDLADTLSQLVNFTDPCDLKRLIPKLDSQIMLVKQNCRSFVSEYERVFPGHLSAVMRSLSETPD